MPATPGAEELAIARRAWRLAILTTGDAEIGRRAMALLPPPRPGSPLDADRLDRLAIQAVRRAASGRRVVPGAISRVPDEDGPIGSEVKGPSGGEPARDPVILGEAHGVLVSLPLQAAEAWVLRRMDDLDPIRMCRAMDCSRSAAERFLAHAESRLEGALGARRAGEVAALRGASEGLIPQGPVAAACLERARARSRRKAATVLAAIGAALTGLLCLAWLAR